MIHLMSLLLLSVSAYADPQPAPFLYVGAIAIEPCHDAKVLADWYALLGIQTHEDHGGYYAELKTAPGNFFFGIHPKKTRWMSWKCPVNVSVILSIENYEQMLATLKDKGIVPDSVEPNDPLGKFADFHDPDGNRVSIWEEKHAGLHD
jgi:hypothetical protein